MKTTERYRRIRKWHLLPIIVISGFYLVSVSGWVGANVFMYTGVLGKEVQATFTSWTAFDHLIRVAQVLGISAASIMLVLLIPQSAPLFACLALGSLLTTSLGFAGIKPQWTISFIGGPDSLVVIALVYLYAAWVIRKTNNEAPNPYKARDCQEKKGLISDSK